MHNKAKLCNRCTVLLLPTSLKKCTDVAHPTWLIGYGLARVKALTKRAFPALFVLLPPRQAVMLWPPCVRCPRSFGNEAQLPQWLYAVWHFKKKNALATRDYSSPPIGFPDSQRWLYAVPSGIFKKKCPGYQRLLVTAYRLP
jgi:hypothetical protein